jgi:3-isopropylmalate/(R)-2-methylmalate dehydratase small subunit
MSSQIERVSGRAIPVRGNDIDTDRIIPARYLKAVTFEGLELHVFEDDRRQLRESGAAHAFDHPEFAGAAILIANANFGCGSSREHAPQALQRWGIRAVVAESFAEIFFGNSTAIGLPCVTAAAADIAALMKRAEAQPNEEFVVDLRANAMTASGIQVAIDMPASARDALVSGVWDATGLLLANYDEVQRAAARLPYPGFDERPLGARP